MSKKAIHKNQYRQHNKIRLIQGGSNYFQLLEDLIHEASHSIHLQMYIFEEDYTGTSIMNALSAAARKNVQVYLIVDGYASQGLSQRMINKMIEAGIRFRYFEPLLKSRHFYFGRRLHEKLVVIDACYALVGGINIADRYNDVNNTPAWLDFALYLEGESVLELYQYCFHQWKNDPSVPYLAPPKTDSYINQIPQNKLCSVRISINDWVKGKHDIWRTYFDLFSRAESTITILCSYFLPGRVLRKQLSKAAKRGVKIRVILAGPSDVMLAKYAERYLYDWMLENNIEIYEYQPTVLHAKVTVVDERWVTIGSFNINNISAYASVEVNLDVRNKPFACEVQEKMEEIISSNCIQITQTNFAANVNFFKRFMQKSSYELIRLILNLTTFYFKEE